MGSAHSTLVREEVHGALGGKHGVRRAPIRPRYRWEVRWEGVSLFLSFSRCVPLAF